MPSSAQKADVASSLSKLSLDGDKKNSAPAKAKVKKPVLDSWEDEDLDSDEEEEEEVPSKPSDDGSKAPPPTPISPTYSPASHAFSYGNADPTGSAPPPGAGGATAARRPEKTDAVARRMIASALGVKVPKQTEEQKAYQQSIREQERKRRDEEKAAEKKKQEDLEKAKAAIWED
ncbi:hypothetical protein Cob_v000885 [Colletotrichum orbiculare MAFF 240422]|uniref:Ubiquitin smt3 n=1 Tax=Colletotrichum orbiculare (strain 104-T / ATCC 96160 / CBS 514.97 / LARS 414 / MAFF 240422) TaxID=1213857 RepID=N4VA09_COLOR|nr:hypothetical protein Cob_v000885 [Colletotrichum orbiculare MAFF 240422]